MILARLNKSNEKKMRHILRSLGILLGVAACIGGLVIVYDNLCVCTWIPLHNLLTNNAEISTEFLRNSHHGMDFTNVYGTDGQYRIMIDTCPHGHSVRLGVNRESTRISVSKKKK